MDLSVLGRDPGGIIPFRWAASFTKSRAALYPLACHPLRLGGSAPAKPAMPSTGLPRPSSSPRVLGVIAKPHSGDAVTGHEPWRCGAS